jgi:hypothetical protein
LMDHQLIHYKVPSNHENFWDFEVYCLQITFQANFA